MHKSCLEVHLCAGLFENQFARLARLEELEEEGDEVSNSGFDHINVEKDPKRALKFTLSQQQFFNQGNKLL